MRDLHLLRHAKSSWDDPALADHDRPLAPRGRRAAALIARHLVDEGVEPALVLCSSAVRARETLEAIEPALEGALVQIERELYGAPEGALLERLHGVPDAVDSVLVIGHNPAIQGLALTLAGPGPEHERIERKFPTAALATLGFETGWPELRPGAAELRAFVRPKDLA